MQAGPSYAEAFLTVLRNVTKEDTVQYVLAVLDQLLAGSLPNARKSLQPIRITTVLFCMAIADVWHLSIV